MATKGAGKSVPSRSTKAREATVAPMRARRGAEPAADESVAPAPELATDRDAAMTDDDRRRAVAEAAYYLAEARGFEPGHEVEDWLAAERLIAERIAGAPRA